MVFITVAMCCTTLCHGPSPRGFAVERNIQCAMVVRVNLIPMSTLPSVIRRKHAAHKHDQGQAVLTIVTQCVKVPPEVAVLWDRLVKPRSAINAAAANCPDMAAIGTPGPGCTLPPARYKPLACERALERAKAAIHPWVAWPYKAPPVAGNSW